MKGQFRAKTKFANRQQRACACLILLYLIQVTDAANTSTASPTKLRNGDWGATTKTSVEAGDVITIRTRGGKEWQASVVKVIWSDGEKCIVATRSVTAAPRAAAATTTSSAHEACDECGNGGRKTYPQVDGNGIHGVCCRQCWRDVGGNARELSFG
jgi:hypothetical protein